MHSDVIPGWNLPIGLDTPFGIMCLLFAKLSSPYSWLYKDCQALVLMFI